MKRIKPDWADKVAADFAVGSHNTKALARALRAAYRRGQREERQRRNTCHVCGVSMIEPQTPPFCIDCGGCDEEKCGHLYIGGKP